MNTQPGIHLIVTKGLSGGIPLTGCCLILFLLLLAACSPPGLTTLDSPSETDAAPPGIVQPSPSLPTGEPQAEQPGDLPQTARADLPDLGPAPELANQVWLNTDQPLRLADLGGKVILLDMWTFG